MWKDLTPAHVEQPVSRHQQRFLAFVDFLGTRELYAHAVDNADLIEDRRHELEHGIHIRLQSQLAARQIEIGLFSDTVLLAGNSAATVIEAACHLFEFSFTKTIDRDLPTDIRLLRGSVASGIELRTSYLAPSAAVHVIPFYDGSLAFAYELESVRKGSRLFLEPNMVATMDQELRPFIFNWKHGPGYGAPLVAMMEFLWPAFVCAASVDKLTLMLSSSFAFWRRAIKANDITLERYRHTLYHWDETIKTIIRSFGAFQGTAPKDVVARALATLLPSDTDRMRDCNIRYIWGVWFQVFLAITKVGLEQHLKHEMQLTVQELKALRYYDKFVAEAYYPDYAPIKELLRQL